MDLRRILVAVDSPESRDAAFERALALARASDAELYVLHAVRVNQRFSFRAAERLEQMKDLRTRAEEAGVRVQTVEQHGDPAEIIELHADARRVDLIVMGGEVSRGWRRRSSVAERVVRQASVPTLVVASDAPDRPTSFRKVLAAVDLSPASTDVLRHAVGLAAGEVVRLTVLHSVTGLEAADAVHSRARWTVPEYRAHVMDDARRSLEALVSELPADVDTHVQLSTGAAAPTILEHAADADLVVVGRSQGFKLLGTTAVRVLRGNDRSLLVIPSVADRSSIDRPKAA